MSVTISIPQISQVDLTLLSCFFSNHNFYNFGTISPQIQGGKFSFPHHLKILSFLETPSQSSMIRSVSCQDMNKKVLEINIHLS